MANIDMTIEVCPEYDMDDGTTSYEEEDILAILLAEEKVMLNSLWRREDAPKDIQRMVKVSVLCNDVFIWGCADAEDFFYSDIPDLWQFHKKDPEWGTDVWCIQKRNMMPQEPVYELIQGLGIWDLDSMNLDPNPTWPKT